MGGGVETQGRRRGGGGGGKEERRGKQEVEHDKGRKDLVQFFQGIKWDFRCSLTVRYRKEIECPWYTAEPAKCVAMMCYKVSG